MPAYQLLALDMDGTLLTSDKRILPRTLDAIHAAAARGAFVALSTGRALSETAEYRPQLKGTVRYASLLSGGHVHDLEADRPIATRTLDTAIALAVAEQGLAVDAMVHVMTPSSTVATGHDVDRMGALGQGIYQEMFRQQGTFVDDTRSYIRTHAHEVCKVNLYHPGPAAQARSLEALSSLDAQISVGEVGSLEFTPTGVTKALGLQLLCDHLGITLDDCVVVGDGFNDVEVLQVAGLAVAMGNADERIKQLADVTVADNDHDGIVEVVERFFS